MTVLYLVTLPQTDSYNHTLALSILQHIILYDGNTVLFKQIHNNIVKFKRFS